jgi:hypothetical protein
VFKHDPANDGFAFGVMDEYGLTLASIAATFSGVSG